MSSLHHAARLSWILGLLRGRSNKLGEMNRGKEAGGTENKLCNKAVSDINMYEKTCKWYNVCPMKRFYEEGKLDEQWIKNIVRAITKAA